MSDTDEALARALHAHADRVTTTSTPTGFLLVLDAAEALAAIIAWNRAYTRPDLEALPAADVRRARAIAHRAAYELGQIKGRLDRIADRDVTVGYPGASEKPA